MAKSKGENMLKKLEDMLLEGIQAIAGISPSMYLNVGYPSFVKVMQFIEATPSAKYADKKLRKLFANQNWALDAKKLDAFFQLVGEVQFWMLANQRGVTLERIPETHGKTADLRIAGGKPDSPQFEVKTLSVSEGGWMHLAKMAEDSFETQIDIQAQLASGKTTAMSVQIIAPHGAVKRGKERTQMCNNLIKKAIGNIKSGQYAAAPTFMVLNLMLIDGHFNGTMDLRPVAGGYPEPWSIRTGVMWTIGFGTMGQIIHGLPEFDGKPGIEGFLENEGVLAHSDFKELAGMLMVVHRLGKEPTIYGLMRAEDMDCFEVSNLGVLQAFDSLAGQQWNDDLDSNGWQLTEP